MPKTPAPEDKELQVAIAACLAALLERKKAAHLATQQATKERCRAYERTKSIKPERATPQFAAAVHSPFAAAVAEVPLSY
jgi:hypothetical protein